MNTTAKFLISGGLFLINVVLGIVLNRLGKPYNSLVRTFHKLSALAFTVLAAIYVISAARKINVGIPLLTAMIAAAVFILALFATGALASILKEPPAYLAALHSVLTILGGAVSAVSLIFTLGRSG